MITIALATCTLWPELSASDRRFADALEGRGVRVVAAPWNGSAAPFAEAEVVVLRSNWDYHHHLDTFRAWLDALAATDKQVFNPPELVRWNLDKRYLLDLAAHGITTPVTRIVPPEAEAIRRTMDEQGWQRAVLKPSVGASGHNVHLLACEDPIADLLATSGLAAAGLPVIVQEFVPEVRGGELAFVFFDGDFSHVFRRRPAEGEFRVNSQYQGVAEPAETPAEAVRQARAVLDALPALPLYARVDGVLRDGRLILMELELNEPGLMLQLAPGSAGRFAEATLRRLR